MMTVPLLILAVPSVIAGYFNMHAPDPLILFASVIAVVFGGLLANSFIEMQPRIRCRPSLVLLPRR